MLPEAEGLNQAMVTDEEAGMILGLRIRGLRVVPEQLHTGSNRAAIAGSFFEHTLWPEVLGPEHSSTARVSIALISFVGPKMSWRVQASSSTVAAGAFWKKKSPCSQYS